MSTDPTRRGFAPEVDDHDAPAGACFTPPEPDPILCDCGAEAEGRTRSYPRRPACPACILAESEREEHERWLEATDEARADGSLDAWRRW
jgi:hypothetical protein